MKIMIKKKGREVVVNHAQSLVLVDEPLKVGR